METKLCKHCQTEIPKKAKVCPNCKKKQGGIVKWIVIVVVVLIILGSVAGSGDSEGKTVDNTVDASGTVANNTSESGSVDNASEEAQNNVITEGKSFEANGLKVTINEVNTNYTDYEDPYDIYAPEDGYKYVMVSFTYENTGDSDAYVSIYDYDCYADGTLCEQSYYFDNDFINANISSGRNVSFSTFYVVPEDATEVELEYTSNIWTSEKVIIKIQ